MPLEANNIRQGILWSAFIDTWIEIIIIPSSPRSTNWFYWEEMEPNSLIFLFQRSSNKCDIKMNFVTRTPIIYLGFNPLTPVSTLFSHRNNIVLVALSSTVRRQRVKWDNLGILAFILHFRKLLFFDDSRNISQ